jgi:hypothetical protein
MSETVIMEGGLGALLLAFGDAHPSTKKACASL